VSKEYLRKKASKRKKYLRNVNMNPQKPDTNMCGRLPTPVGERREIRYITVTKITQKLMQTAKLPQIKRLPLPTYMTAKIQRLYK